MTIIKTEEEIIQFYKLYLEINKKKLHAPDFCKKNNIEYKQYSNYRYIFNPWVNKYADSKEIDTKNYELYKNQKFALNTFCKENNLNSSHLSVVSSHFKYMEIIKDYLNKDKSKMQFLTIEKEEQSINDIRQESQEIIPIIENKESISMSNDEKNYLEIIINKEIKISIGQSLSSERLIKIIELLRNI